MSHKKQYNPLMPFIIDVVYVNLHVNLIDTNRFVRERLEAQGRLVEDIDEKAVSSRKPYSENNEGSISIWLRHNDNHWKKLLGPLIILFFIVQHVIKDLIVIASPQDRDPKTNQYLDPLLNYMNSIYLGDFVYNYKLSLYLHILGMLLLTNQTLTIFTSWRKNLKEARDNVDRYTRINIIQTEVNTCGGYTGTLSGWWNFVLSNLTHKCDLTSQEAQDAFKRSKELSRYTADLHHLDKMIFYNHIDFSLCYKNQMIRCLEVKEKVPDDIGSVLFRPRGWTMQEPIYRMDSDNLAWIVISGVSLGLFSIFITVASIYSILASIIDDNNLEPNSYKLASIYNFFKQISNPQKLNLFIEAIFVCASTANNAIHIALFAFANSVYRSRTRRVHQLFQLQMEKQISYRKAFTRSFYKFINDHGPIPNTILYANLIEDFRAKYVLANISQSDIETFNDDLRHLVFLIDVVQREFIDIRHSLSDYMNMYVLFGALAISIFPRIISISCEFKEWLLIGCMYMASLIPLIYTLVLGASIEMAVSKKHQ